MRNFPINFVIDTDLPQVKKFKTVTGYAIDCPFCGKQKKFDVNLSKNFARCNVCGNGDDVNKGFNSLTLHAKLCKATNKEAYADLWNRYKNLPAKLKAQVDKPIIQVAPQLKTVPLWIRDKIYRTFLEQLSLSKEHEDSLIKRGLSKQRIKELNIKDVPVQEIDCSNIFNKLFISEPKIAQYFKKHSNAGVAGFYNLHTNPKCVARQSGILIPIIVKNPLKDKGYSADLVEENLISGFQIRYDKVTDKKYTYWTSAEQDTGCGFSGCESIHFAIPDSVFDTDTMTFVSPELNCVALTEGCLKADVASYLSNDYPFIAVLGVSNQRFLSSALELLKRKYNTKKIVLVFDADYENNEHVAKAMDSAVAKIAEAGLEIDISRWTDLYHKHNIKGIDDLLLYQKYHK